VKTNVTDTSIEAYYSVIRCGREGSQKRQVFNWVRRHAAPCTRQQIVAGTGLAINIVTARVFSLLESGALERGVEVETDEYGNPCRARETVMVKSPQLSVFDGLPGQPLGAAA